MHCCRATWRFLLKNINSDNLKPKTSEESSGENNWDNSVNTDEKCIHWSTAMTKHLNQNRSNSIWDLKLSAVTEMSVDGWIDTFFEHAS